MTNPSRLPVVLPDLGSNRVAFSLWYVRPGDRVFEGDRVAEVLIPGATFDVHAPGSGVVVECVAFPNDALTAGQVLGYLSPDDS